MRSVLRRGLSALWLLLSVGNPLARQAFASEAVPGPAVAVSSDALKDAPASVPLPPPSKAKQGGSGIVPVASIWLLGGESSLGGSPTSRTGSASVLTGFSVPLKGDWKILPIYQGYYEATKQIFKSSYGTELIQQRQDHRFNVKLVHDLAGTPHRLKLNFGYRTELVSETKDEGWGHGLFDYSKPTVGAEWEYFYREPFSLRASYDFFLVRFPNYMPLESEGALSVGGHTVARELVGGHVLDSRDHLFQFGASGPMAQGQGLWDASYALTLQDYRDQPIVTESGQLRPRERRDMAQTLALSLRGAKALKTVKKVDGGLRLTCALLDSNQNNYDAFRTRFIGDYYSYREFRVGPHATIHFANPRPRSKAVRISLSMDWAKRQYPHRTVQDAGGGYLRGGTWTDTRTWSGTLVWPVAEHASIMASYRHNRASSNMRYEAFYRYNYANNVYLLGVGLEW